MHLLIHFILNSIKSSPISFKSCVNFGFCSTSSWCSLNHCICQFFWSKVHISCLNINTEFACQIINLFSLSHFTHVWKGVMHIGQSTKVWHTSSFLILLSNSVFGLSNTIIHCFLSSLHLSLGFLNSFQVTIIFFLFYWLSILWFLCHSYGV